MDHLLLTMGIDRHLFFFGKNVSAILSVGTDAVEEPKCTYSSSKIQSAKE